MSKTTFAEADLWNELHQSYDRTLAGLFVIAARRGIELLAPDKDSEVLDVACGPGTLALEVASRVRRVVAVDFSSEMLKLLEQKCQARGVTNIEALVGDGTALPFESQRFDAAFSCFGVFLFADRKAGFSELWRVVRPGAKVMISSFAPPGGPIEVTYRILRELVPELPVGRGSTALGTRESIIEEMTEAGFVDLHVEQVPIRFEFPSADAFWEENSLASVPFVATRRHVGEVNWPVVEARIVESLRRAFPGRVDFERLAWVAVGRRPTSLGSGQLTSGCFRMA